MRSNLSRSQIQSASGETGPVLPAFFTNWAAAFDDDDDDADDDDRVEDDFKKVLPAAQDLRRPYSQNSTRQDGSTARPPKKLKQSLKRYFQLRIRDSIRPSVHLSRC